MALVLDAVPKIAECAALLVIGANLRSSGLFRPSDGKAAVQLATSLTLPSVIIRALCTQGPIPVEAWVGAVAGAACIAAQSASAWALCSSRGKRERAVIAGSCTGLSLGLLGYPLVETLLGSAGLQVLALVDLANGLAVSLGSYLVVASAGPAFPEAFKHEDGGTYRGQWRGMRKEGLGVYTYTSGAKYEGEWRDNVKDGRGVYYFPKGGTYEGEWVNGTMNGVGIRTFSTGAVKAGRWRDGQLETPMEVWQCVNAAEGAAEAALGARSVPVGGGTFPDAVYLLLQNLPFWAIVASLGLHYAQIPLPTAVDVITSALAPANRPLMLLAAGMTLAWTPPPLTSVAGIARILAARLAIPLAVCGCVLGGMLAVSGGAAVRQAAVQGIAAHLVSPQAFLAVATLLLAGLMPSPPEALAHTSQFKLNEALAQTVATATLLPSLALAAVFAFACAAAGLLPRSLSATLVGATGSPQLQIQPLLLFTITALAAIGAGLGYLSNPTGSKAASATGLQKPAAATQVAGSGGGAAAAGGGDWKKTPLGAAGIPPSPGGQQVLMVYTGSGPGSGTSPGTSASSSTKGSTADGTGQSSTSQPSQPQDQSTGQQGPVQPPLTIRGGYGKSSAQAALRQQQQENKGKGSSSESNQQGQNKAGEGGGGEGAGGSSQEGQRPPGSSAALPGHSSQLAAMPTLPFGAAQRSSHRSCQLRPTWRAPTSQLRARLPLRAAHVSRAHATGAARAVGIGRVYLV